MADDIKARLSSLLNHLGISQNQFASRLEVSQSNFNQIINGKRPLGKNMQHRIITTFGVNPEWLSEGKGQMLLDKSLVGYGQDIEENEEGILNIKSKGVLPLLPIDVVAGFPSFEDPIDENEYEYYNVPEFASKGAQYLIKVSGDSMFPRYSNGDILACKKISSITFFQWGKVYVLDTQQGALVKRVFEDKESKDNIICRSENSTDYPDFALPKIEIRSLSIVVGVIRME